MLFPETSNDRLRIVSEPLTFRASASATPPSGPSLLPRRSSVVSEQLRRTYSATSLAPSASRLQRVRLMQVICFSLKTFTSASAASLVISLPPMSIEVSELLTLSASAIAAPPSWPILFVARLRLLNEPLAFRASAIATPPFAPMLLAWRSRLVSELLTARASAIATPPSAPISLQLMSRQVSEPLTFKASAKANIPASSAIKCGTTKQVGSQIQTCERAHGQEACQHQRPRHAHIAVTEVERGQAVGFLAKPLDRDTSNHTAARRCDSYSDYLLRQAPSGWCDAGAQGLASQQYYRPVSPVSPVSPILLHRSPPFFPVLLHRQVCCPYHRQVHDEAVASQPCKARQPQPGRDGVPRAALVDEILRVQVGDLAALYGCGFSLDAARAGAQFEARSLAPRRAHGLERAQHRARRMRERGLDGVLVARDVVGLEERLCKLRRAFRIRNGLVGARAEHGDQLIHALATHAAEELVCQAAQGTVSCEVVRSFDCVHEFVECDIGNGMKWFVGALADGCDYA
eukprot:scaffold101767_cov60-Phaeocystis_antarctica.AAC.8